MTYRTDFDPLFQAAAAIYLPDWQGRPWLWQKAQAICESNLDPNVTAKDGGRGIAQFMDATWNEMCAEIGWPDDPNDCQPSPCDPNYAIPAMAYYLHTLWSQWSAPRSKFDRMQLTQASFNCGLGSVIKAQRLSGGAAGYDDIIAHLPAVTGGANAGITTRYVERIAAVYSVLTEGV